MLGTVPIPASVFRMGSPQGRADERPVHETAVAAFHLCRTAVTRAEYAAYLFSSGVAAPPWWAVPGFEDPAHPVVGVSWEDATAYAGWLTAESGMAWRLPTEAEWECAARGGLDQAPTPWGAALPENEIPGGPLSGPWPVAGGAANGLGLYDMGTIVHEWCQDWYDPVYYARAPRENPRGPDAGTRRASRGGSWRHRVRWSPPAARSSLPPSFRYADYGFRLARD